MLRHEGTSHERSREESICSNGESARLEQHCQQQSLKDLISLKKTFIVPAFVVFLLHYFALAVLVGYVPHLASARVIGTVNIAYLFALSQFVVGGVIAGLYLFAAAKFDALTGDILAQVRERQGGQ